MTPPTVEKRDVEPGLTTVYAASSVPAHSINARDVLLHRDKSGQRRRRLRPRNMGEGFARDIARSPTTTASEVLLTRRNAHKPQLRMSTCAGALLLSSLLLFSLSQLRLRLTEKIFCRPPPPSLSLLLCGVCFNSPPPFRIALSFGLDFRLGNPTDFQGFESVWSENRIGRSLAVAASILLGFRGILGGVCWNGELFVEIRCVCVALRGGRDDLFGFSRSVCSCSVQRVDGFLSFAEDFEGAFFVIWELLLKPIGEFFFRRPFEGLVNLYIVGFDMEDIGLFKQGWKWLHSRKHVLLDTQTAISCFKDRMLSLFDRHWPMVCHGFVNMGKFLLMVLLQWRDSVVRGFRSLILLGSTALFIVVWSCFLSFTSTACLIYVLLTLALGLLKADNWCLPAI
ncbi:hypothetical protein ACLOJK_021727 [Asimina triloba]